MSFVFIFFYNIIWLLFILITCPYWFFLSIFKTKKFKERFGIYNLSSDSHIWIHAASVGEVNLALNFLKEDNFKNSSILLSIVTSSGYYLGKNKNIFKNVTVKFAPLDFFISLLNVLNNNIKSVILLETELWPTFLYLCKLKKIPVTIVNGRISEKSYKKYLLLSKLIKPLFNNIDLVVSRSIEDKFKFSNLGFKSIELAPNMKYSIHNEVSDTAIKFSNDLLFENSCHPIFVAGSIRSKEEIYVINAFIELKTFFPDITLIIAPRHLKNIPKIEKILKIKNISFEKISSYSNKSHVLLIDKFGVLASFYKIADVVFVGGSLVPKGGHNIIEPISFGKPVIFGSYMDNFKEEAALMLNNNAAIQLSSACDLSLSIKNILTDQELKTTLKNNTISVMADMQEGIKKTLNILKNHGII